MELFPRLRYMGNKYKLVSWLSEIFDSIDFETVIDPFSGSGTVSYLLKAKGHSVISSDFLNFPTVITKAIVENNGVTLSSTTLKKLLKKTKPQSTFAVDTFEGIFYTKQDLEFIDMAWNVIPTISNEYEKNIAIAALVRSCAKRQPRGVFTVAGDPSHYKDGRRDLELSIKDHFVEQIEVFNHSVFSSSKICNSYRSDVFLLAENNADLVYLDPPYIPEKNDNCYMKRYHFLEGVSCHWEGQDIMWESKVHKIRKPVSAFNKRATAIQTFERLFEKFKKQKIVLSYSSNSIPSLEILVSLLKKQKRTVEVFKKDYRYHFGNHIHVEKDQVEEYLIVGQ